MKVFEMRGLGRAIAVLAGVISLLGCHGQPPKTVLDQKAVVGGFWTNHNAFCQFDIGGGAGISTARDDELGELHLKKGSKFKLKNRRMEEGFSAADATGAPLPVDFLNVDFNSSSQIEDPDMRVFNAEKDPLETDYCESGGDLSQHVYVFGIHEMTDPKTGLTNPHAFIYIPMNVSHKASRPLGNRHYLAVLSIENDSSLCEPPQGEQPRPDYKRCVALRQLAVFQMNGMPGKDFRREVENRILDILPATTPYPSLKIRFHNGVIHGNL